MASARQPEHPSRPEVWGGVECSFLEVDGWLCDQVGLTGHASRPDDLDRIADLGVRAVRYPVLWGRTSGTTATDWEWADARLTRLRSLGIRPIVGLLHHGFGRIGIDPLDPEYPSRFANYATQVAERFPWVDTFIPVNEPLTTARFGALYGWWPPYARDHPTFIRLLVSECLAFRAATKAFRRVRSDVSIIVTEDAGRTYGTQPLASVVEHDDLRRWLTFDLLMGKVDRRHRLWSYMTWVAPDMSYALDDLAADPASPDVLGLNRYITSDRFLDHRVELYPAAFRGGGGGLTYADVEAVRVGDHEPASFIDGIRETWQRYGRPIALTEVQLAGAPQDQIAWWTEAWRDANRANDEGIPVRAVTAWALFGSWEWDSVLRRPRGRYEVGCFDARDGTPRAAPLAAAVARTAMRGDPGDGEPGWWRTPRRVAYAVAASDSEGRLDAA